jgi:hypothetical protein
MHSSFSDSENASNENHKMGQVAIHCVTLGTEVAQETKLKTIGCGTTRWQHRPWIFQEHQFQMESEITWLEIHLFQLQS